jgi:hypothetical protein
MHVFIVFTQILGEEIDLYEATFLHESDAKQHVKELNSEIEADMSYYITVKVNQ